MQVLLEDLEPRGVDGLLLQRLYGGEDLVADVLDVFGLTHARPDLEERRVHIMR